MKEPFQGSITEHLQKLALKPREIKINETWKGLSSSAQGILVWLFPSSSHHIRVVGLPASLAGPSQDQDVSHAYMLKNAALWYSERGLLVRDSQPARSQGPWCCEDVGVHLLQARMSVRARAFKRERSQRWENREDAEASQRLTVSWAKVKPLSMQRFKCCPVESFAGFTFLPE